jgi:FkbM family methyltransferase
MVQRCKDYLQSSNSFIQQHKSFYESAIKGALVVIKKLMRTIQSHFGMLKPLKDNFYFYYRGLLHKPSQPHFKFLKMLPREHQGLVLDVGGNIGQSVQAIRMYLPRARILSFEPNPHLAEFIEYHYRSDQAVEVKNFGLGTVPGTFRLHVPVYRGFVYDALASFDRGQAASWLNSNSLYFFNPAKLSLREYECHVQRLDDLLLDDIVFIKIDVEGFEAEVVLGGLETIRRSEPILMVEDFHEREAIRPILFEIGYQPFRFDGSTLKRGESDTSTFLLTPKRIAEFGIDQRLSA